MKRYSTEYTPSLRKGISKPIRNHDDFLIILLESIKAFLVADKLNFDYQDDVLLVVYKKMSRLFFRREKSLFSICFPYHILMEKEGIVIYNSDNILLNNQIISNLLSIINMNASRKYQMDFYELLEDIETMSDKNIDVNQLWKLYLDLLIVEPGYIRYDMDIDHENGSLHPLHHLDICYSSNNSYKIGLYKELEFKSFIDILNTETESYYLNEYEASIQKKYRNLIK